MMSRRHFAFIASVVAILADPAERRRVALDLAAFLAGENPRFDRERFLRACGADQ